LTFIIFNSKISSNKNIKISVGYDQDGFSHLKTFIWDFLNLRIPGFLGTKRFPDFQDFPENGADTIHDLEVLVIFWQSGLSSLLDVLFNLGLPLRIHNNLWRL